MFDHGEIKSVGGESKQSLQLLALLNQNVDRIQAISVSARIGRSTQHASLHMLAGTSASAPTFAAMVSLLNEARLKQGKPAMGFINPFLYQHPAVFTDIVGKKRETTVWIATLIHFLRHFEEPVVRVLV